MSIALESSSNSGGGREGIERPGFIPGMPFMSIYEPPEPISGMYAEDRRSPVDRAVGGGGGVRRREEEDVVSSSSSSIGRNSDSSGKLSDCDDSGDHEVQSSYEGPLDTMDSLEDVLPVKRGISRFYSGKSKSFTSLADASSISSIKELAKPENPYTRKRKNLLASNLYLEKNCSYPSRNCGGGLSKRPANSIRNALTSAMAESSNSSGSPNSNSCSPCLCLPPLHPQRKSSPNNGSLSAPQRAFSSCRSFSLSDLQCAAASNQSASDSAASSRKEGNRQH
ncbi:hypothetical protein Ancab_017908 [Ancistrocladus abbreviatus]